MDRDTLAQFRTQPLGQLGLPALLSLLPAAGVVAFWVMGVTGLYAVALGAPVVLALFAAYQRQSMPLSAKSDTPAQDIHRSDLIAMLDTILADRSKTGLSAACFLLDIDDYAVMRDRLGVRAMDEIDRRVRERLSTSLRRSDRIAAFGAGQFGLITGFGPKTDLEGMLQITARIQRTLAEPIVLSGTHVHLTVSIGFAQPERVPSATGAKMMDAADAALREANNYGPGSVRAYSPEIHRKRVAATEMIDAFRDALELGQVRPWFQPQISTDTGEITGFEALARWTNPEKGMIPPSEFLPAAEAAGLLERLGEVMLYHSLTALKAWDRSGLSVPTVGVNFATDELRNPALVDKIAWELDRFDLEPKRLTVEVLENVIADSTDDIVSRNITGLSNLGCCIDLDDFGTGHSSITNIRRFSVTRLKIDRSFVMRVDSDQEQQRMVAAILTMAERLNLETLAEGVESGSEHAMLSQLGCGHVQGYGIGRPMPFEDTLAWMAQHTAKLAVAPRIGGHAAE
ncbi:MAG: bifunctional diguanylate cyclase/phosphodiesterase [Pseudomonadota bacterium]